MQLLSEITITHPQRAVNVIQLLQGDLSAIPTEHAADILIISAYPGSYVPVPKTLIAALNDKGLSIEELAKHKAIDLRDQLGCWLSQPLTAEQQEQFNFKQVLCFEPWHQTSEQAAVIGNIFRCINTFVFSDTNDTIAMPVLASGKQKVPFEQMLPALLDASIFWLENGLPLACIKLVVYSDQQAAIALPVFKRAKEQNDLKKSLIAGNISGSDALKRLAQNKQAQLPGETIMEINASEIQELADKERNTKKNERTIINVEDLQAPVTAASPFPGAMPEPPRSVSFTRPSPAAIGNTNTTPVATAAGDPVETDRQYDYFVSYAHKHTAIVDVFVNNMRSTNKDLQLFYDRSSIPAGGLWIKQISDAIQRAKKVLIFLSPDYSNSPVCWDEFQCAKLVEYNSKKPLIQTIYLYNDTTMPPIMGIYSWADCREGDTEKLQKIAVAFCAGC